MGADTTGRRFTLTRADRSTLELTPRQHATFWQKIKPASGGCLAWSGAMSPSGYGTWTVAVGGGRTVTFRPHRVAYELVNGAIPEGMTIDHLCRNKVCCNVDHLDVVTQGENTRRSMPYREPQPNRNRGASIYKRKRRDGSTAYRVYYRLDGKQLVVTFDREDDAERFATTCRQLGTAVAHAERTAA